MKEPKKQTCAIPLCDQYRWGEHDAKHHRFGHLCQSAAKVISEENMAPPIPAWCPKIKKGGHK